MDYISCGYPDLSFHGREAWRPDLSGYSHVLSMLYCGLYDKGFDRIGCILCPMARKDNIKRDLQMFPDVVEKYRQACNRAVAKRLAEGKTYKEGFQNGDDLFNWWLGVLLRNDKKKPNQLNLFES